MNTTATPLPQLTFRAILLAIILAMLLAAANTYLGLFAGLTIASAIPAAVVSMGVLRALGGGHILENNIVQTGASAAASIAAGVIFTIPALVILGYWSDFRYMWVFAIAGLGGILGVLFSVPLRRALILEQKLAFPEGKAAAEVLRAGENPEQGIKLLAGSALLGGIVKLAATSGLRLIPDTAAAATYVGKGIAYFATNLSPALFGVGYIVGLNVGIVIMAGGVISWNIAIPIYAAHFLDGNAELAARVAGAAAEDAAYAMWSAQIRYLGVGAMLIGGVWTLISLRKSLLSGVRSGLEATSAGASRPVSHTEQDIPMKAVLIGIVLFTLPLFGLYQAIVGSLAVSMPMTIIMIVAGFLFCSVSAYMAGLVGSSNNPVSGITIFNHPVRRRGADRSHGSRCAARAGRRDHDRRSRLLRSRGRRRQSAGSQGRSAGRRDALATAGDARCRGRVLRAHHGPVLNLLEHAYGIGVPSEAHPRPLLAPQATLMASVSKGMFGGVLPWPMVWIGSGIGAVIIIIDQILRTRGSRFRVPVLGQRSESTCRSNTRCPIFLGGLLTYIVERIARVPDDRGCQGEIASSRCAVCRWPDHW